MMGFLLVLFSHLVGDYALQSAFLAEMKGKNDVILAVHCGLWTGAVSIALYVLGMLSFEAIAFLFVGHFIVDRWKARQTEIKIGHFYIDQVLHVVQCAVVYSMGLWL
jgi:hypothetical protein